MRLEFYPSNPGLTPARVKLQRKDKKPPSVPLMTASRKAYLKNSITDSLAQSLSQRGSDVQFNTFLTHQNENLINCLSKGDFNIH